ncbi:MAG: bifunctional hydroxymethylpyrimidine kinase/phosphomethylpyrimidine kinase [Bacteroides sp.]|nr:bifunctional hydroxymethylpyrimidine kinase/phosphomethylpyrimidine kinase [Bacteroides sp.]MCM1389390.1 bifunctional hydroxymethylpyrimidine kinase/phosphomethylpyrimidine kinase [Bacteroides sp.]
MKHYPTVLSIAGSDPSGGAGIQADIKTCTAMGCYAMTAITALTAQNTLGVRSILNASDFLNNQLLAMLDDITPDAVKIGMLPDGQAVMTVASVIEKYALKNIVLDPVMAATSGDKLATSGMIDAMCRELLPKVTLLTPNIPEAEGLSGLKIASINDAGRAARRIAVEYGITAVLVKGGHLPPQGDLLFDSKSGKTWVFEGEHIDTPNTHGTGCTLSSAIACGLACGLTVDESVERAKSFITSAIKEGADYAIGHGHGAVNHLYNIIKNPIQWK